MKTMKTLTGKISGILALAVILSTPPLRKEVLKTGCTI